jgi:uncharacterized protein YecE (DUF72 family)
VGGKWKYLFRAVDKQGRLIDFMLSDRRYLYSEDELREWVGPVRALADEAERVHVLMNNCYRDYAVRNARQLAALLAQPRLESAPATPPASGQ